VSIKKDRIVKIGTNEEFNPWIGKDTKVIGLKIRTVVLCFINTHGRCGIWKVLSVDQSKRR
jgi:predicted amidohydrolase YtcJ